MCDISSDGSPSTLRNYVASNFAIFKAYLVSSNALSEVDLRGGGWGGGWGVEGEKRWGGGAGERGGGMWGKRG